MEDNNFSNKKNFLVFLSSLSTSPLFSFIVVLQVLILLYLPHLFLRLLFSPVLIFTGIVLCTLLRYGSTQFGNNLSFRQEIEEFNSVDEKPIWVETQTECMTEMITHFSPNMFLNGPFVEWTRKSPLEVIYEEYEGEEEGEEEEEEETEEPGARPVHKGDQQAVFEGFVNWGLCSPESDTESSSDEDFPMEFPAWDSPENLCFRWEDEKDGMIEIPLRMKGFPVEEENLIEIDLSVSKT